jgi:hypothetical protein
MAKAVADYGRNLTARVACANGIAREGDEPTGHSLARQRRRARFCNAGLAWGKNGSYSQIVTGESFAPAAGNATTPLIHLGISASARSVLRMPGERRVERIAMAPMDYAWSEEALLVMSVIQATPGQKRRFGLFKRAFRRCLVQSVS